MRRFAGWVLGVLGLLAVASLPAGAEGARAQVTCPDILIGDSLAVGMAPHARDAGWEVIARVGAGIAWLRQQDPRCARRLVLMFGTNDLRGMKVEEADAYLRQIADAMERWPAARMIWATPGCFSRDTQLEQGSATLDQVLSARLDRAGDALRHLPAINRGREARCSYASADGVHPTAEFYRSWWQALVRTMDRTRVASVN